MKLKPDFVLRKVVDMWVVLPIGEQTMNFNGMLTLNNSGVLLWQKLQEGSDREGLAHALMEIYEVVWEEALADVDDFLRRLQETGCLETDD